MPRYGGGIVNNEILGGFEVDYREIHGTLWLKLKERLRHVAG